MQLNLEGNDLLSNLKAKIGKQVNKTTEKVELKIVKKAEDKGLIKDL